MCRVRTRFVGGCRGESVLTGACYVEEIGAEVKVKSAHS